MISYAGPGERYDGGFVAVKSRENGQKVRAYVQRMRELSSSVTERNERIQDLKGQVRRRGSSNRPASSK
jgi:hypothetical protein